MTLRILKVLPVTIFFTLSMVYPPTLFAVFYIVPPEEMPVGSPGIIPATPAPIHPGPSAFPILPPLIGIPVVIPNPSSPSLNVPAPLPPTRIIPLLPGPSVSPAPTAPSSYLPQHLVLKIIEQTPFGGSQGLMRKVLLQWNGTSGKNVAYKIYTRPNEDAKDDSAWDSSPEIFDSITSIILHNEYDWYIRIGACAKSYPYACVFSPSVFLPKHGVSVTPAPTTTPTQVVVLTPAFEEKGEIEGLAQQVDTLQKQLEESKQRQSILEKTFYNLLKWLKSHFPFFPF